MVNKFITITVVLTLLSFGLRAQTVTVSTDVEAEFFFNGQSQGTMSQVSFKLKKNMPTMIVTIKKTGYVPVERRYSRLYGKPPKSDYIKLVGDEAYNSSVEGDFANKYISIETAMSMDDA